MNETLNGIFNWIGQALGAGAAVGAGMIGAGADLTQKSTWTAVGVASLMAAWAHLRDSPLPSSNSNGAPK